MILIIAYGNSLREDDRAGLVLAEMIERACRAHQLKVERIVAHQLTPELSLEVARKEISSVVFVDTRAITPNAPTPQVQVRPIGIRTTPSTSSLGHHLSASSLLVYAQLLYDQHPPAWEATAPGVEFGHGETLSPIAQAALATAQKPIEQLLTRLAASISTNPILPLA